MTGYSSGLGRPTRCGACRLVTLAVALGVLVLGLAGCSTVKQETATTKAFVEQLTGSGTTAKPTNTLEVVQTGVMREADLYVGSIAQATQDLQQQVPTFEAREMALQWKLMQGTAAYINASGERPEFNAVDMVVLATLSRYVVQDYWVGEKLGEAARPLLEVHLAMETNTWTLVRLVLSSSQQDEVRSLLQEYRQRYPHLRYVAAVRMREMAGILGDSATVAAKSRRPGSLFSLLYLNPLAGLDPTTQAIEETRLLAQRMFYYAQRAPMLLSWQVELTTTQLASQPEARQVLADLTDVGASLKVFANTASGLTNLVNAQREAAINQIFDRLARERTNLVADLAAEQTKLRALLDESRRTLDAGATMATSVNAAIQSLDSFVRYVSPPATNPIPSAQATNGQPFNVLDYGTAATQVGAMATELTALLQAANQSEAQVSRLGRQTTEDLRGVVNHAFRLGLVLLVASAALGWFLVISWRRRSPSPPPK